MNAIIAVCHFCEAHGPCVLFCTHISKDDEFTGSGQLNGNCSACSSIGSNSTIISKEPNGIIFCSRESLPNVDANKILKHAAIRSLSCEVSLRQEGGIIYFGDTNDAHILSLTFQLKDSKARGLKRWFSIIVLMRDKMFLLNVMPFLTEHLESTVKELQLLADGVYEKDQMVCSQRALRLQTGKTEFDSPRSLVQLTGDINVFKNLHQTFTWILHTGATIYKESFDTSQQLLSNLKSDDCRELSNDRNFLLSENGEISVRRYREALGNDNFRKLLFCMLTGKQVIVRGQLPERELIANCLNSFIPELRTNTECHHAPRDVAQQKISSCDMDTIVPDVSCSVCHLLCNSDGNYEMHWPGEIPLKCPTLLLKMEKALVEEKLNDDILNQQLKSLVLEWLGITRTMKSAKQFSKQPEGLRKLRQALGVTTHDEVLLDYWIKTFVL